jgi:hypothetical protein
LSCRRRRSFGPLPDQAALHDVLAEIEALGLELLGLRRTGLLSRPSIRWYPRSPRRKSVAGTGGGLVPPGTGKYVALRQVRRRLPAGDLNSRLQITKSG